MVRRFGWSGLHASVGLLIASHLHVPDEAARDRLFGILQTWGRGAHDHEVARRAGDAAHDGELAALRERLDAAYRDHAGTMAHREALERRCAELAAESAAADAEVRALREELARAHADHAGTLRHRDALEAECRSLRARRHSTARRCGSSATVRRHRTPPPMRRGAPKQRRSRSACYAPFVALLPLNGDVVACCKSTHHRLGNVARQRLPEIWSGERVAALRAELRRYELGAACRFCRWQIESGHANVHAKIFDELPAADGDAAWPARMDFTLSNACNLACVMCCGELSSTIRAQRDQLPPLRRPYGDAFFRDLRPFLAQLRHATFLGGEPFLAAENHRVWDLLIEDRSAPRCHVITNGTQWNERVERVLDALPMDVSLSIDGVTAETVERLRVHVRFETLMENVARFRAACRRRDTRMSIMFCLMPQNWHEFGPLLRLAEEQDVDVDMNVVVDPPANSLHALPAAELAGVVAELTATGRRERFGALPRNGRVWRAREPGREPGRCAASFRRPPAPIRRTIRPRDARGGVAADHARSAAARRVLRDAANRRPRSHEALLCRATPSARTATRRPPSRRSAFPSSSAARPPGSSRLAALESRRGDAARRRPAAAGGCGPTPPRARAAGAAHPRFGVDALGDVERALAELRAASRPAGSYDVATTEAWICRAAGRYEEAQRAIDQALRDRADRKRTSRRGCASRKGVGGGVAPDAAGARSNVEMAGPPACARCRRFRNGQERVMDTAGNGSASDRSRSRSASRRTPRC